MLKNPNYKVFEESFAKTKPKDLAACRLGEMMEQDGERRLILTVLNVYLTGRQKLGLNPQKDTADIFSSAEKASFFEQHYQFWQQRSQIRG